MNQKFYKINCYFLNPANDGEERYLNPTQISLISPRFEHPYSKNKGKVIGSSIKLSSDTSDSHRLLTSLTPDELVEMFSK